MINTSSKKMISLLEKFLELLYSLVYCESSIGIIKFSVPQIYLIGSPPPKSMF